MKSQASRVISLCKLFFLSSFYVWIPKVKPSILTFWVEDHFKLNSADKPCILNLQPDFILYSSPSLLNHLPPAFPFCLPLLHSHFPASLSFVLSDSLNFLPLYHSQPFCMVLLFSAGLFLCLPWFVLRCSYTHVFFCLTLDLQFALVV